MAISETDAVSLLAVSIREIPDRGMIDMPGLTSDRKFMAEAMKVIGVDLPKQPRSSVSCSDLKVLWLSVDHWLILCRRAKDGEFLAKLRAVLGAIHSLAADVSDARAIIRMECEGSREVLMKGTSLDLLSGEDKAGACRRMHFAEIASLLHVVEDNVFDNYVFRSYVRYPWEFLLATARESAKVTLFGKQPVSQ